MPRLATLAVVSTAALTLLVGCQSSSTPPPPTPAAAAPTTPQPTTVVNTQEGSVIIQSVDMDSRLIVIQDRQGKVSTVKAGPEVHNLAQVRSGDRVVVRYTEALVARLAPPGPTPAPTSSSVTTRAPTGAKPAVTIGDTVTTTVTFLAYEPQSNVVSFTPPDGVVRAVTVKDLNMRSFVSKLKQGDKVDITYTEAVAVSVEPSI